MKTKITEIKFKSALGVADQLLRTIACFGTVILICASAPAQNLFVSGYGGNGDKSLDACAGGKIFEFSWDRAQSTFAHLCTLSDVAFDSAGNLYVVNWYYSRYRQVVISKYDRNGVGTLFASGLNLASYLSVDTMGNVFVADYNNGVIYKYAPNGARTNFASGLYHPVGMAFDSAGNLFVADHGSIYEFKPDGSRTTFAVLDPSDRPADLAFDSMGNLFMADFGGNIYRYALGVLRRHPRTTFGSVPNSAQSLAFDSTGDLLVVDAGDLNGNGNAIYKFNRQALRSLFASGQTLGETFEYLAFQPMPCCQ